MGQRGTFKHKRSTFLLRKITELGNPLHGAVFEVKGGLAQGFDCEWVLGWLLGTLFPTASGDRTPENNQNQSGNTVHLHHSGFFTAFNGVNASDVDLSGQQ